MTPESTKSGVRGPHQLPRGKHGISRSDVVAHQLGRIMEGVAEVLSEKGYAAMSVEDVITAAGVSRRTFYDHFKSKEEAYLAGFDAISQEMFAEVTGAAKAQPDFVSGVIEGIRKFLEMVSERPLQANMCIVEVLAAGPNALERRNEMVRSLASLFREGMSTVPGNFNPPESTAEMIMGGIYEVVYARLSYGQAAELPGMLPDIVYAALLPYIGRQSASEAIAAL